MPGSVLNKVSCKKVYPTLKVNTQDFLLTKTSKNIQTSHLNKCNFDNYQFFSLMTLGEIIELYLQQGNFLENLIPTLNKDPKIKASVLKIDLSCHIFSFFSQRCIQGPVKHLRWKSFCEIGQQLKSINIFAESFVSDANVCNTRIPSWLS